MSTKKAIFNAVAVAVVFVVSLSLFNSCGGEGGGPSVPNGSVALYATDSMSDYKQVIATINKVSVMNTGSGAVCDVLTTPTTIDIANLSSVLQLLNVANCPAVPYNRVHMEFEKSVELMNYAGQKSSCLFTSYKDDARRVNTLTCSGATCTLDINGAVNVLVNQYSKVALDFDLKDFDVVSFGTGTVSCSVTMKVSPLHGNAFGNPFRYEGITGLVSDLTTSTDTFTLSRGRLSINVLYSGITSTRQPGLDDLLLRAQQDGLRTRVTTSSIDYAGKTIEASGILVKAEGLVSNLTTSTHTFTLTYKKGKTMMVDYGAAVVKGDLLNNAWAEVGLYGYGSASKNFLAARVAVEYECTVPHDQMKEMDTED